MLLSIIIPVYNEELTIGNIIDRTKAAMQQIGLNYEIIVVDDRSYDKSLEVAKRHNGRIFTLKQHFGKGYALRAGFAKAKGDIIVTIDSDGSHRPEELPEVLAPVLQDKADLVIGSRYLNHKRVAARKLNAFGVRIFNLSNPTFNRNSHNRFPVRLPRHETRSSRKAKAKVRRI